MKEWSRNNKYEEGNIGIGRNEGNVYNNMKRRGYNGMKKTCKKALIYVRLRGRLGEVKISASCLKSKAE